VQTASELRFELAAQYRDEISELSRELLELRDAF
jgi:excinuclease UvrABC helicase subunit UvrB